MGFIQIITYKKLIPLDKAFSLDTNHWKSTQILKYLLRFLHQYLQTTAIVYLCNYTSWTSDAHSTLSQTSFISRCTAFIQFEIKNSWLSSFTFSLKANSTVTTLPTSVFFLSVTREFGPVESHQDKKVTKSKFKTFEATRCTFFHRIAKIDQCSVLRCLYPTA